MQDFTGMAREMEGARGTLVFGNGITAVTAATIKRVGDGFIVAEHFTHDRSPAGETVTHRLVIPISSVAYFRTMTTEEG